MKEISLAYSQDTDDAFMVYALQDKLVDTGAYRFVFVPEDIQKLNEAALQASFDISAVSMAMLPLISQNYQLMPIGASVGDHFGPVLVVSENSPIRDANEIAEKKLPFPENIPRPIWPALTFFLSITQLFSLFMKFVEPCLMDGSMRASLFTNFRSTARNWD